MGMEKPGSLSGSVTGMCSFEIVIFEVGTPLKWACGHSQFQ